MSDNRYRYPRPRSPTLPNPFRASLPLDVGYSEYAPIRSDHYMHATPSVRREIVPASRSSAASISTSGISTSGPVTTTTYKISSDPLKRGTSVREDSRRRGSTLDNSTRPSVAPIVTSGHRHRDRPVVHITSARPSSPLQDPYRSSQEDYYSVPASSKHHHHRPKRYSTTVDNADINRLARERDTSQSSRLRITPREGPAYTSNRTRPSYTKPIVRDTADYGDDGYGYTTPRDLVAYDLDNTPTAAPRHHSRHHSNDRIRPTSIAGFADIAPGSYARDRPPVTTRQFDRIPATRPVAPVEYERPEVRPPPPMDPIRPVRVEVPPEAPRRKDSVSRRPVSYYHDREKRPSGRDDYYEVRDDERGYRSERHRHHRDDDVVEQRGYSRTDREPTRSEVRSERPEPARIEPVRIEPVRERHESRVEPVRERHESRVEPPREHKHEEEHKDHKGRDAAIAGLSLAGAALGVKAFKDAADHDDDEPRRKRDYDDEPRRRHDPRDDRDAIDLSGRDPKERRHRDESPRPRHRDDSPPRDKPRHRDESPRPRQRDASPPREKAPEVLDLSGRNPKERHNSRDEHDSDPERREIRRLRSEAPPANGTAIETESSASDETVPRRRRKASTAGGVAFNPRNTMDLYALKEALNNKEAPPPPPPTSTRTPRESMSKDGRELAEVRSGLESERAVRIVTPPPVAGETKAPVKGILRAPREKFPEDPAPIREGVAPLKDAKKDGVPPDARWTKISRKLVNPEALEAGKERYEAREDFVIVLRVLSRDEVQGYAEVTERIRAAREEAELAEEKAEKAARRRARRERHERHKRERAEGIDRPSSRSERRRSHRESHSESDSTSDEGDKVHSHDRHGSIGDRDRDRGDKPRAIEGVSMSGALGEKRLPTKEDLARSGIKENPEAPGQYIGYTRNPPPPPEAVLGKLRKTESH